ncbi:hypothetical protein [Spirochaeta isovalerica]|uniref:Uncharacterized protein n=1 Tax=Spirochaeta isovalerica TaxID=150 RepID=A0A841R6G8_9SPIO|nr:hypothetical protein [Spirochaeta isovalerica]MBB6479433.1 hypothetical protein [Spirochaeta isovalerica]
MARHNYSSDKRQKEIKRQKRQEEKRLRKERKGTEEGERDEQDLINGYLGIEPETEQVEAAYENTNQD